TRRRTCKDRHVGRASLLASCLLGVTTLGATASPNRATSAHQNEPAHLWVIDGTVSTIAPTPAGVFVGGDFTLIGPPTGSWVEVGATGAPLAPKPRIEGGVTTATPDDAGGWYLRGDALTIAGAE